jgi:hypothetical protein
MRKRGEGTPLPAERQVATVYATGASPQGTPRHSPPCATAKAQRPRRNGQGATAKAVYGVGTQTVVPKIPRK